MSSIVIIDGVQIVVIVIYVILFSSNRVGIRHDRCPSSGSSPAHPPTSPPVHSLLIHQRLGLIRAHLHHLRNKRDFLVLVQRGVRRSS